MNKYWLLTDRIKEFILLFYRKNVFLARIKSRNSTVKILGKVYVSATNVTIGNNVIIYPNVYFWGDGKIEIGNNVSIGIGTVIYAKNAVKIHDNVAIAGYCYIIDSNHSIALDKPIIQQPMDVAKGDGIVIGNDVWIGAGCKIIKGAKIQNGAVIGAMSLVNGLIDEYTIAVGIPAKSKRKRN